MMAAPLAPRLVCCLGLLAWGVLWVCVAACGELPPHLAGEPADALVRRLEPGHGFAVGDDAAGWSVATTHATEVVATHPASGLALRQQRRWLPDLRLFLINTTLANTGKAAVAPKGICVGDWTFRVADDQDSARYRPLASRNDVWYGSTYWTGPDWTRVGKDWHHPGQNTPSVRRFTCPRDGTVTVTGRVCKAHVDPKTDGVRLAIRHGAKTVWQAEIDGGDAQGVEPKLELEVRRGDALRFVVHKRGLIFCDTTRWDPVVAYADGETFVASKGFSTKRQGDGGWSYEMEIDLQGKTGLPTVYTLDRYLAARREPATFGRTIALSPKNVLPLFVLADGDDKSGVVVAVSEGDAWRFGCSLSEDGRLRVQLATGDLSVRPGESMTLPQVAFGAYRGTWAGGFAALQRLIDTEAALLREEIREAFRRAFGVAEPPKLDLWAMLLADWGQQDKPDNTAQAYIEAATRHIAKARELLADLRAKHGARFLAEEARQLEGCADLIRKARFTVAGARGHYVRVRWLKRRIILANPLMQFGPLVFCKRVPTSYSHLVMQYYGWRARPGGGLSVLEAPGRSLATRRIFDASEGCVLEPRLSYDAKQIVFSYVHCPDGPLAPGPLLNDEDKGFYHVWAVNADGTGLRQLTRGPYDDVMPTWLPDGGIAFCSTRRKGYARCFGGQFSRRWHVYTLHRMAADGSNLRTLSFHDTNEWFPAVTNTGHLLYARWDYIDRDAVTHQNLWLTRPDGTNPVALWGNAAAAPHCAFQAQPVPGSPKILFTASAHHSITGGSIVVCDPTVHDNSHDALVRITPEIPFPEAESRDIRQYYAAPWPVSEDYYLVAYGPRPLVWEPGANDPAALGLYTLDRWGNRELLYRDPEIGSTNPCPLAPRPVPPVLHSAVSDGEPDTGEMLLLDVYQGLGDMPGGTVKALRVVQILPKTTHVANSPPIGLASEENARAVLGTVPVEPDGSARFIAPARKPLLFQALDADGFAYQSMRSITYVQPGETTTCIGCHERRRSVPASGEVLALRRPPSALEPGPFGGEPFSYVRVVQPVLDRHCVKCHDPAREASRPRVPPRRIDLTGVPHQGFTRSYWSLCGDVSFWAGGTNPENAAKALVPRFGGRNPVQVTPPGGLYGARGSRLLRMLRKGHNGVKLTPDELGRLALWIDLNAIFYGVYLPDDQARQLRGDRLPLPTIQ